MSVKILHKEDEPPQKPTVINMEKLLVVGDSAVVADGPKRGDVIVSSRVVEDYRLSYSGLSSFFGDNPRPEPKWFYTTFTYYRVEAVSKPDGVCHGHSLLTLKELG